MDNGASGNCVGRYRLCFHDERTIVYSTIFRRMYYHAAVFGNTINDRIVSK